MTLLLDIGNSRIKWAVADGPVLRGGGNFPHGAVARQIEALPFGRERLEPTGRELSECDAQLRDQLGRERIARRRRAQLDQAGPRLIDARGVAHADVEPDADHRAAGAAGFAALLDQDPAELLAAGEQVVRPFERDALDAQRSQRAHARDADRDRQDRDLRGPVREAPRHR